ncbi:MAG: hypothetical protein ACRCYV_09460 [Aeromonas sp.]
MSQKYTTPIIIMERPTWVLPNVAAQMTGYTERAIKEKVRRGQLVEGLHFRIGRDHRIVINWRRFEEWMCGK